MKQLLTVTFWAISFCFTALITSNRAHGQCVGHAACTGVESSHTLNGAANSSTAWLIAPGRNTTLQSIYLAADLTASGLLPAAVIEGVRLKMLGNNPGICYANTVVRMAHTTKTFYVDEFDNITGLTTVASAFDYEVQAADFANPTMYFDNPFTWNGTDNIVLEFSAAAACGQMSNDIRTGLGTGTSFVYRTIWNWVDMGCSFSLGPRGADFYPGIEFISCGTVLPLTWLNFEAKKTDQNLGSLEWKVADQGSTDYFTVEKSYDKNQWETVASVQRHQQLNTANYSYLDPDPVKLLTYYRIKQTDLDGTSSYTQIRSVSCEDITILNFFPNPSPGPVQFELISESDQLVFIRITDATGRLIKFEKAQLQPGINQFMYSLMTENAGKYIIEVISEDQSIRRYRNFSLY